MTSTSVKTAVRGTQFNLLKWLNVNSPFKKVCDACSIDDGLSGAMRVLSSLSSVFPHPGNL